MTPAALLSRLITRHEAVLVYVQTPPGDREGRCHITNARGFVSHKHHVDRAFAVARASMVQVGCEMVSRNEIWRPLE